MFFADALQQYLLSPQNIPAEADYSCVTPLWILGGGAAVFYIQAACALLLDSQIKSLQAVYFPTYPNLAKPHVNSLLAKRYAQKQRGDYFKDALPHESMQSHTRANATNQFRHLLAWHILPPLALLKNCCSGAANA